MNRRTIITHIFTAAALAALASAWQQPTTGSKGQEALPGHHVSSRGCVMWNDSTGTTKKMTLFDVGQTSVRATMDPGVTGRVLDIETGDTVECSNGSTVTVTGNGGTVTIGTNCHVTVTQYGNTPVTCILPGGTTVTVTGGPTTFNT